MPLTSDLPPGLRPWAPSLAFFTVEAALHLGPLVRRVDALVRRHDAHASAQGEPDGYGDLSRRGHPEQMLLSEWLLAEEVPLEFLRRAAARELLHLTTVTRAPQPRGRVVVLADVGPDQVGAPRLVQLAALVVLHRRAQARGLELVLGLTGQPADRWEVAALPELFLLWRRAHHHQRPALDHVAARRAGLDADDELWVLAGEDLGEQCGDLKLVLRTRETAWGPDGVTAVEVAFEGRRTTLAVPPGPLSVHTLRGRALRRAAPVEAATVPGSVSCPSFASCDRRLLLRGERDRDLLVVPIPTSATGGAARPRRHDLGGTVIAAASMNRRLVALVCDEHDLRCVVVGKHLGWLADLVVPLAALGLDPRGDGLLEDLAPLYYHRGALLCRLAGTWWRLKPDEPPRHEDVFAMGPSRALDLPRQVWLDSRGLLIDERHGGIAQAVDDPERLRVIVGTDALAWSWDERWHTHGRRAAPATIIVDEECEVLGVLNRGRQNDPALITRSKAGLLVRLHSARTEKTLTRWSGPAIAHAVHPALPFIAVQRDKQTVEVGDLITSELLMTVRAG